MAPSFKPSLPAMRWMASSASLYISLFLAAVLISLSAPRNLLLQYVPNAYTSSGKRVMPFLLALFLSLLILMQLTQLPIMIIWIYWVFSLLF
jgi:hypothetical protein